jgi:diguanylate cyclase (GGDEF)-like protein/PAS domain S-box-containing protein
MSLLGVLSLVSSFIYFSMGLHAFRLSPRSQLHRAFLALSISLTTWAFAYSFIYASPTKEAIWFWYYLSSLGWCTFAGIALHFFIILSKHGGEPDKPALYPLIYVPCLLFVHRAWTGVLLAEDFIPTPLGWVEVLNPRNLWFSLYCVITLFFVLLVLLLTWRWKKTTTIRHEARQAAIIFWTAVVALLAGGTFNLLLPALGISIVPAIAPILILGWAIGLYRALTKHRLMELTPAIASEEILARIQDLLVLTDGEGAIVRINQQTESLTRFREEELKGKPIATIMADEQVVAKALGAIRQVDRSYYTCETNWQNREGEYIPIQVTFSALRDRNNEFLGFVIVGQDTRFKRRLLEEIVVRKRTEDALMNAQEHLETRVRDRTSELAQINEVLRREVAKRDQLEQVMRIQRDLGVALGTAKSFEVTVDVILSACVELPEIDCGGLYFVDSEPKGVTLVRYRNLSEPFIQLASHYNAASPRTALVLSGKPVYVTRSEIMGLSEAVLSKEGLCALAVIPIKHEDSVVACLNLASHMAEVISSSTRTVLEAIASQLGEVVMRLKMEQSLLQTEEKFRTIFDKSLDAIYVTTRDGTFLDANPAYLELFSYSWNELKEMNASATYADPLDRNRFRDEIEAYDSIRDFEVKLRKKNGDIMDCLITAVTRHGLDGAIIGYEGIIRDVTERKRMEEALKNSQQRLSDIIEYLPDPTFVIDRDGKVIAWNRAIEEMTGVQEKQIIGKGDYEYALPFYGERRPILIDLALCPDTKSIEAHYPFVDRDASTCYTEVFVPGFRGTGAFLWAKAKALYGPDGELAGAIETIRDTTDERLSAEGLRQERERFFTLLEHAPLGILMIDPAGRFIYQNPAFRSLFGYSLEEIPNGRAWFRKAFPSREYRHRTVKDWINDIQTKTHQEDERVYDVTCRDGSVKTVSFVWVSLETGEYLITCQDITDRVSYEERLTYLATHDSLTGLLNRHSLEDALKRSVAKARRGTTSSLLYMDLDDFKNVNDLLGHPAGDSILVQLSDILEKVVRLEDTVFRVGGDEFAVLLDSTDRAEADWVAERIRRAVEEHDFTVYTNHFRLTFTIGLVGIDGNLDTVTLIARADTALYRGKAKGRNMVVAYEA